MEVEKWKEVVKVTARNEEIKSLLEAICDVVDQGQSLSKFDEPLARLENISHPIQMNVGSNVKIYLADGYLGYGLNGSNHQDWDRVVYPMFEKALAIYQGKVDSSF
jgi:hypothetical protein